MKVQFQTAVTLDALTLWLCQSVQEHHYSINSHNKTSQVDNLGKGGTNGD